MSFAPRTAFAAVLLTLLTLVQAALGHAQSGAISTLLDPSITASGMGRAGSAVFWELDVNDWANPALLGYQRGIRYTRGKTQLVPDLADDVFLTSDRFALGAWGLGLSIAGKPIDGLGKIRLDYGISEATDVDGNVIGTFSSYEQIHQLGVGVNVIQLLESVVRARGGDAGHLSRYGDVSLGHAWKSVVVDLAPASVTLDQMAGRGEADEKDRGALVRVTPIGAVGPYSGAGRAQLDLSGSFTQRNYGGSSIFFVDEDNAAPIQEERLVGIAGRFTCRFDVRPGGIWDVLKPEVSVGGTWEQSRLYWGDSGGPKAHRTGQEVTLLGLFSVRHGFVDDEAADMVDDTWGISAGLQYRGIGGVRYDWAQVPQSSFLRDVHREGFSIYFDPYRLCREARHRGDVIARD